MSNTDKITAIVLEAVKEINEEEGIRELKDANADTPLYGSNGTLDSIALVRLLSEVEFLIDDEFEKDIVLANERAMSQKISPFRSIRSLVAYIEKLIEEDE